jgi:hypothetical protein
MKLKTFLITAAVVSCASGFISLLIPAQVMSLYGVEPNPAISLLAQYSGLGSFALGLVSWFSRNMELSLAKKTIIPALLISNIIGMIISAMGALSGAIKSGRETAVLYFIFAVGYAWFLFKKSQKN